jgi:F0F1-type ATP synthase membrane subunit b/b'
MQRHYSTAQLEEMRAAVGKVVDLATARARREAAEEKETLH